MRSSVLLPLLFASACTWVSPADFEARLGEMDDDGDGVPAAQDCDDHDATVSPVVPEVWYDGRDERCDGGDDYDADGDGFYPVTVDTYGPTDGVDGTGELPGGDCDDADPLVSPQQNDRWYDGIDQNCDGVDDFDQDGDGYVPAAYAGRATLYADGTGQLPGGDCDDTDASVNPGATDVFFDGVDTDCAGNDDYDQDGDGFVDPDHYDDYGPTTYVNNSGNLPNGDCDDSDPDVYPGAHDDWYDGLDADCAGDSDYDQDGDGYDAASNPDGSGTDCDDGSPDVHPGALETIGDGPDGDCDGDADGFPLIAITGYSWDNPHDPVFGADADHVYLSVLVDFVNTGSLQYYDSGVAPRWGRSNIAAGRDGLVGWNTYTSDVATNTLTDGQGFLVDGSSLYGALGVVTSTTRALRLVRYTPSAGTRAILTVAGTAPWPEFEDVSVDEDGGTIVAVGCEDQPGGAVMSYLRVSDITSGDADSNVERSDTHASQCEIELRDGDTHIYTVESQDLVDTVVSGPDSDPVFTPTTLLSLGGDVSDVELVRDLETPFFAIAMADEPRIVLFDGTTEIPVDTAAPPVDVAVSVDDGMIYVAWADSASDAWLIRGSSLLALRTATPIPIGTSVDSVGIRAGDGYLLYAGLRGRNVFVGTAGL